MTIENFFFQKVLQLWREVQRFPTQICPGTNLWGHALSQRNYFTHGNKWGKSFRSENHFWMNIWWGNPKIKLYWCYMTDVPKMISWRKCSWTGSEMKCICILSLGHGNLLGLLHPGLSSRDNLTWTRLSSEESARWIYRLSRTDI